MFGAIRSGMATAMHELSVVSNNVANAGSTAYKKSVTTFADIYGSSTPDVVARTTVGQGATISQTKRVDSQGPVLDQGGALDLAIIGAGMFVLSPPDTGGGVSGNLIYSRDGKFGVNSEGDLVASDGAFVLNTEGEKITVPFINGEGDDATTLTSVDIGGNGKLTLSYNNIPVEADPPIYLQLAKFPNTNGMAQVGANRFVQTSASGLPVLGRPGEAGFGQLQSGAIEGSNVDITQELTLMMRAQQQFNGSTRLLQANSDMVEKMTR